MEIQQTELIAGASALMFGIIHELSQEPKEVQAKCLTYSMKSWLDSEMGFENWYWSVGLDVERIAPFFRAFKETLEQ